MSETVVNTGAAQAAPKPKRPKPKSMLMIGEQSIGRTPAVAAHLS